MKKKITKEKLVSRKKAIDKIMIKCGKIGSCEYCDASAICKGSMEFDIFTNDELRKTYNAAFDDYVTIV